MAGHGVDAPDSSAAHLGRLSVQEGEGDGEQAAIRNGDQSRDKQAVGGRLSVSRRTDSHVSTSHTRNTVDLRRDVDRCTSGLPATGDSRGDTETWTSSHHHVIGAPGSPSHSSDIHV